MNLQKAEVKLELMRLYHEKLDGMKTGVQSRIGEIKGALEAVKAAHVSIDKSHKQYYQAELDEGKIHIADCKAAMRILDRVLGSLDSLSQKYMAEQLTKQGEIKGLGDSARLMQTEHDREEKRLRELLAAIERGDLELVDGDLRPSFRVVEGQIAAPGGGAAADIARRRAEARAAKSSGEVQAEQAPVEAPTASEAAPEPEAEVQAEQAPVEAPTASEAAPEPEAEVQAEQAPVEAPTASEAAPEPEADGAASLREKIAKVRARKRRPTRRRTG